jgi:hypothetical protein
MGHPLYNTFTGISIKSLYHLCGSPQSVCVTFASNVASQIGAESLPKLPQRHKWQKYFRTGGLSRQSGLSGWVHATNNFFLSALSGLPDANIRYITCCYTFV